MGREEWEFGNLTLPSIFATRTSLTAQLVKNPPAMQETLGSIPGSGRSAGEGQATHSAIFACRIPTDRGAWWATVHEAAKLDMTE